MYLYDTAVCQSWGGNFVTNDALAALFGSFVVYVVDADW